MNNSKAIQSANIHAHLTHAQAKAGLYGELPAHSPLSWSVHESRFVADKDGAPVVNMGNPNKLVAAANAEHIVKAVNLMPELLEAIEAEILHLQYDIGEARCNADADELDARAQRLRAVLLKAKGSL